MARRTLAGVAVVEGTGLHTGRAATARCFGAPSGQGIVFRRTDLDGSPSIPARISEVQSTERRTALGRGDVSVQTVEHLLAAAASLALEGFIHCTDGVEALGATFDRHYGADRRPFLALTLDLDAVGEPWRYDVPESPYPHIYGPIRRDAIL